MKFRGWMATQYSHKIRVFGFATCAVAGALWLGVHSDDLYAVTALVCLHVLSHDL